MCYGCMARDRKYQEEIEVLKDRVEFWEYEYTLKTLESQIEIEDLKLQLTNKYSSIKEIS